MRFLHTCLRYPPALGGVETYVRELVERTLSHTHHRDVRVLTSKLRTHHPISLLNPDDLLDDPPYVQRLFTDATPYLAYPRLRSLAYYLNHHQPDIIHAYSFWYQPADVAARFARRHKVPFIFFPMFYTNKVRQKPVWQIYKKTCGRRTFAAADVVAVISPYEQSLIESEGFPVKKFILLPPGVDSARLNAPRPNPFAARGIEGQIILSVSRLAPGKGLTESLLALAPLLKKDKDLHYVIVGADFGVKAELEQITSQEGLTEQIHLPGPLPEDELAAAYQHATVFVHPSFYEAFGIVLAEAATAGTPVVARRTAAIPYVIPDNKAGLLFDTDEELRANVQRLLNDADLYKRLSLAGREHIQQNFNWDETVNKLYALYEELK